MAMTSPAADQRRAILDAARVPVEAELRRPVRFKVDTLRVDGTHAFLRATMEDAEGRPIDLTGTRLAEAAAQGFASRVYAALLERRGDAWTVIDRAVGPTDVAWADWATRHRVPAPLFAQ
jgi:hypothetical protein